MGRKGCTGILAANRRDALGAEARNLIDPRIAHSIAVSNSRLRSDLASTPAVFTIAKLDAVET
jgi:hypothetical protein